MHLILERSTEFLRLLLNNIIFIGSCSSEKDRYYIEFLSGGFYKVLIEWAKGGMKESDEYMAGIVCDLIK